MRRSPLMALFAAALAAGAAGCGGGGSSSGTAQDALPPAGQRAQDHIQTLMTSGTTSANVATEAAYFQTYHQQYPSDNVGTLGNVITGVGASVDQLVRKYGIAGAGYTGTISFRKAVTPDALGNLPAPGRTALATLSGQIAGSAAQSRARGRAVSPAAVATDIETVLIPALRAGIAELGPLTTVSGVIASFTENGQTVNIRAQEVQAFRAALNVALFAADTAIAYSWDQGAFDWNRTPQQMDLNADGRLAPSEYLPPSPFGTLVKPAAMPEAWSALQAALTDAAGAASGVMASQDPNQLLYPKPGQTTSWSDIRAQALEALAATATPTPVKHTFWNWSELRNQTLNVTVKASALWTSPPADLKALMPTFSLISVAGGTDRLIASVPDKTLGGVLPNAASEVPDAAWAYLLMSPGGHDSWSQGSLTIASAGISPAQLPHGGGTVTLTVVVAGGTPVYVAANITDPQQGGQTVDLQPVAGQPGTFQGTWNVPANTGSTAAGYGVQFNADGPDGFAMVSAGLIVVE